MKVDSSSETWRPLDFAIETDSPEAIRALVRHGANLYVENDEMLYPLQYAVTSRHEAAVDALLDSGAQLDMGSVDSPLHRAIVEWPSCESIAKTLVERGADVNQLDENWDAPLHVAAEYGIGGAAAIEFLVQAGADVNYLPQGGWTPLHAACRKTNPGSVVTLLEHGAAAALTLPDFEGNTPLHIAAKAGSITIADMLLTAAGDDTALDTAVNHNGDTPASYSQLILAGHQR